MDKVSIIIPCYFYDDSLVFITERCLDSLRFGRPEQVIVVDDGSPVSVEPYESVDEWIKRTPNGGYAAAVNVGLELATGEIIIISNNDITFTPGWLAAITKPLSMGYDIASICTSDTGYRTEDKITAGDKFGSLWAMRREVYDTIGGLDESFGLGYFEDLDYQKRAEDAGFTVGKNHAHLVEHEGKATFKLVDRDDLHFRESREKYRKKYGVIH